MRAGWWWWHAQELLLSAFRVHSCRVGHVHVRLVAAIEDCESLSCIADSSTTRKYLIWEHADEKSCLQVDGQLNSFREEGNWGAAQADIHSGTKVQRHKSQVHCIQMRNRNQSLNHRLCALRSSPRPPCWATPLPRSVSAPKTRRWGRKRSRECSGSFDETPQSQPGHRGSGTVPAAPALLRCLPLLHL